MMQVWFSSFSLLPHVLKLDSLFVLGGEQLYICCLRYFVWYAKVKYQTSHHREQTFVPSNCGVKPKLLLLCHTLSSTLPFDLANLMRALIR